MSRSRSFLFALSIFLSVGLLASASPAAADAAGAGCNVTATKPWMQFPNMYYGGTYGCTYNHAQVHGYAILQEYYSGLWHFKDSVSSSATNYNAAYEVGTYYLPGGCVSGHKYRTYMKGWMVNSAGVTQHLMETWSSNSPCP